MRTTEQFHSARTPGLLPTQSSSFSSTAPHFTMAFSSSTTPATVTAFFLGLAAATVTIIISERAISKKIRANDDNTKEKCPAPRRYGAAIKLKPEKYRRYRELHDHVWDKVLERMYQSNIRNFTIYYHKETDTMFQHFEWIGHWKQKDGPMSKEQETQVFDADMKAIANDPITREWWTQCEPCQEPFSQWDPSSPPPSAGGKGDWWAPLECVNHCGHWPTAYSSQQRDPDFATM